jgi:hypothetical protein
VSSFTCRFVLVSHAYVFLLIFSPLPYVNYYGMDHDEQTTTTLHVSVYIQTLLNLFPYCFSCFFFPSHPPINAIMFKHGARQQCYSEPLLLDVIAKISRGTKAKHTKSIIICTNRPARSCRKVVKKKHPGETESSTTSRKGTGGEAGETGEGWGGVKLVGKKK